MNIFILSEDQKQIATWMTDKHIVKILLEIVQMLSGAYRIICPEEDHQNLYKMTHKNHPVSIWIRESKDNFLWALSLCDEIHREWRYRYGHPDTKFHKSYLIANIIRDKIRLVPPSAFPNIGLTKFALAMPDEYKTECPIQSYRNYYQSHEKQLIASWKNREIPTWFVYRLSLGDSNG